MVIGVMVENGGIQGRSRSFPAVRRQEKDRHHSLLLIIAVIGGGARLDARAKSPVFRAVHGPFPPSGGIRPVLEHG
jgi:hypothetical protein